MSDYKLMNEIEIYTDGSCINDHKIGAWAALILYDSEEILLKGIEYNTTHNRMELFAVLKAFEYTQMNKLSFDHIRVFTDSQYVADIENRIVKFISSGFLTKSGKHIQNIDLVKQLIEYIDLLKPKFTKVKAHQKKSNERNINREVDKIARKLVRDEIKKHIM